MDNKKYNGVRHGDISLHPIAELPEKLKTINHNGEFILAYGEVTGHAHRIKVAEPKQMEILQDKEGRFYLKLTAPAEISHEEHKIITVLPGIYRQGQEREFNYYELAVQKVLD